ncbi:MAG: hypothetical protein U5K71_12615 [Gracilimonas sp.]|nr:hypothetical protein [Gracilimonas sp.]
MSPDYVRAGRWMGLGLEKHYNFEPGFTGLYKGLSGFCKIQLTKHSKPGLCETDGSLMQVYEVQQRSNLPKTSNQIDQGIATGFIQLTFLCANKRNQCSITGLAIKSGAMQDTVILKILLKNLHRPELSYQAVFCLQIFREYLQND